MNVEIGTEVGNSYARNILVMIWTKYLDIQWEKGLLLNTEHLSSLYLIPSSDNFTNWQKVWLHNLKIITR